MKNEVINHWNLTWKKNQYIISITNLCITAVFILKVSLCEKYTSSFSSLFYSGSAEKLSFNFTIRQHISKDSILLIQILEEVFFHIKWVSGGSMACNGFSFFIYDELGEIPFYEISKSAPLLVLKIVP